MCFVLKFRGNLTKLLTQELKNLRTVAERQPFSLTLQNKWTIISNDIFKPKKTVFYKSTLEDFRVRHSRCVQ